jgi:two-component system alkaline phosphatase synthesis response regulator PhoP
MATPIAPTILVVDDEPKIAQIASDFLQHAGYGVIAAADGETALELARTKRPALVVLDLKLPGMDGLDVAKALRRDSSVPIIMLTARVEESDRLRGLALGADDYLTKPFSPRELVARVKAVLRRTLGADSTDATIRLGDVTIDPARQVVTRREAVIDLTPTEMQLLTTLARQPGRVLTRSALLDAVRGAEVDAFERAIDAHIKNIRRKIESDPRHPTHILTVYGMGYKAAEG